MLHSSTKRDQWQAQPVVNPFNHPGGINGQHVATVQVHGGMHNGVGMNPQPVSASVNFNNANAMTAQQQYVSPSQPAGGISGAWTADLARTLPQAQAGYSPNMTHQPTNPASPPNPFNNAIKTFEVNLWNRIRHVGSKTYLVLCEMETIPWIASHVFLKKKKWISCFHSGEKKVIYIAHSCVTVMWKACDLLA